MDSAITDTHADSASCSRFLGAGLVLLLILSPGFMMVLLQLADLDMAVLLLLWAALISLVILIAYYLRSLGTRRGIQ